MEGVEWKLSEWIVSYIIFQHVLPILSSVYDACLGVPSKDDNHERRQITLLSTEIFVVQVDWLSK